MRPYINLYADATTHHKIFALASALSIPIEVAFYRACSLWLYAMENAPDGDISDMTPEEMIHVLNLHPETDTRELLNGLVEARLLDLTPEGRYLIHNWGKHGGKLIARKERARERRLAQKSSTAPAMALPKPRPIKDNNQLALDIGEPNEPVVAAEPEGFKEFWEAYPRKVEKKRSIKTFKSNIKKGDIPELITAAQNVTKKVSRGDLALEYVMYPDKFLRDERWRDWLHKDGCPSVHVETAAERAVRHLREEGFFDAE